jgi:hypothetical protein
MDHGHEYTCRSRGVSGYPNLYLFSQSTVSYIPSRQRPELAQKGRKFQIRYPLVSKRKGKKSADSNNDKVGEVSGWVGMCIFPN